MLEPWIRNESNQLVGTYYLCVYGLSQSTYKLIAKNEDHSLELSAGISESGYIKSDQIKLFYFTDAILKDEAIKLEFSTHVATGKILMKTKLCEMP